MSFQRYRSYLYLIRNLNFKELSIARYKIKSFDKHKSLFIHIPKAAGVSLHKTIYQHDSFGHIPITYYRDFFSEDEWNNLFKFSIVRNPISRCISAYNYLRVGGRGSKHDLKYQEMISSYDNIDQFIELFLGKGRASEIEHFIPQSFFVTDSDGQIMLDFIGKVENIDVDIIEIANRLGRALKLDTVNVNKVKKELNLSKASVEILERVYEQDFELFQYEKI